MSVVLWNRRVLPWFQYGDNLGLSPYGLHEAYVEQQLVSFRTKLLLLFHQYVISVGSFIVL